jgi:hypothetical protein
MVRRKPRARAMRMPEPYPAIMRAGLVHVRSHILSTQDTPFPFGQSASRAPVPSNGWQRTL